MLDLSKVRNYYIACGYTDMRLGIDGLAAIVTQQYSSQLDEELTFHHRTPENMENYQTTLGAAESPLYKFEVL